MERDATKWSSAAGVWIRVEKSVESLLESSESGLKLKSSVESNTECGLHSTLNSTIRLHTLHARLRLRLHTPTLNAFTLFSTLINTLAAGAHFVGVLFGIENYYNIDLKADFFGCSSENTKKLVQSRAGS